MIKQIHDSKLARDFLNSVPFDEYVPEGLEICCDSTIILGWFDPDLVCCFPFNKHESEIEIHCACLRKYRGKNAVNAARHAFKWIFENTNYNTIFATMQHSHVKRFAAMCGMRKFNGRYEAKSWADL